MTDDPSTVAENAGLDNSRGPGIDGNLVKCLICLAVVAGGLCWTFRNDFSRKPVPPAQVNSQTKSLPGDPNSAASQVQPAQARHFGVNVGDTVEISALNPVVAAHNAVITAMNDDQLTIRVGSDTYAIRWENIDRLKAEPAK
jgi:hypothetical protein